MCIHGQPPRQTLAGSCPEAVGVSGQASNYCSLLLRRFNPCFTLAVVGCVHVLDPGEYTFKSVVYSEYMRASRKFGQRTLT